MHKRQCFLAIVLSTLSFVSFGQTDTESFVKFNIRNAGLTVEGNFSDYKAEILYDENDVSKSKFYGEIKTKSINTGINVRDNHLRKMEYFDVENFPVITFKSTVVSTVSAQRIKIIGDLTMKGITQKIVLDVEVIKIQNNTKFSTSYTLNRIDFKVGGKSWTLADELDIFIQVVQ